MDKYLITGDPTVPGGVPTLRQWVREAKSGLSVRSGAGQAHPKGPGPVSSSLDTGGLTGGDYLYHLKILRETLTLTKVR